MSLNEEYGKHTVYTNGGIWYPEACNVSRLKHYLHSSFEKSLMERVNQYLKDRIENFDDYYPCMQNEYNLFYMYNWKQFFVFMYNDTTSKKNNFIVQLKMEMNLSLTQPELASFDINYSEHFNTLIF